MTWLSFTCVRVLPCAQSLINDSYITLHPTDLCTPEIGAVQFDGLKQLAISSASNATDIYTNGTVGHFADWAAPVPVLSKTTKVSSAATGCARLGSPCAGTNIIC